MQLRREGPKSWTAHARIGQSEDQGKLRTATRANSMHHKIVSTNEYWHYSYFLLTEKFLSYFCHRWNAVRHNHSIDISCSKASQNICTRSSLNFTIQILKSRGLKLTVFQKHVMVKTTFLGLVTILADSFVNIVVFSGNFVQSRMRKLLKLCSRQVYVRATHEASKWFAFIIVNMVNLGGKRLLWTNCISTHWKGNFQHFLKNFIQTSKSFFFRNTPAWNFNQ